jgi:hypothetical protein
MAPLDGRRMREVNEALLGAFGLAALDRLLLHGIGLDREHLSVRGDLRQIVFDVTQELNRQERIPEFVAIASDANPSNRRLAALAGSMLAGPLPETSAPALERLLSGGRDRLHDPDEWRLRLGRLRHRVARVEETGRGPLGTAVLIGPDLALTNHHVLARFLSGQADHRRVRLRFGMRTGLDRQTVTDGIEYALASDWLVDAAPPSPAELNGGDSPEPGDGELDFAVIRLAAEAGTDHVDGLDDVPGTSARGWVTLDPDRALPDAGEPLFVLQHPAGGPLRLAFDRVLGVNRAGNRIRHAVDTERGSSGSPCFDRHLDLVALHHSGDPAWHPVYNQAVPIAPIARRLAIRVADGC